MTLPAPTYDLVLLLDPQVEAEPRAKIVADTRATVEAHGELLRHDEWGERPLSYPIEKRTSAEYHLLQFHVGSTDLLSELDRTLRITDGLLRFRIVKLKPGVPEAPTMGAASRPEVEATTAGAPADLQEPVEAQEPVMPDPAPETDAPEAAAEAPEAAVAEPA